MSLPDAVRQSELLNQLVLNRSTMEELGRIEVMWMYPPAHRVLGFVCKTGFWGGKRLAFKLSQVEAIGVSGVITHSQPDETDAERVRQLESLIQTEVWSNAGHKLGKIIDCVFDLRTGVIADYLVVGDRLSTLTGSIYRLPPSKIVSLGRERVLVAETSLQNLTAYREGLQQKIAKVSTTLKEEYEDVTDELRSLAKRAQETTQQTTGQIKTLAEQAKERAQLLAEQARERAQELNEQWLENAQTLAEKARETSETFVERVQDTTQEWGEQLKEIQTVTVPAREVPDLDDDLENDLDEDLEWDEDFLFDDEEPSPPKSASPQPPVSLNADARSVDIKTGVKSAVPQATTATPPQKNNEENEVEDFWVITEDLTLQRPTAQDKVPFTIDEAWDIDDDPWDITEPPTVETAIAPVLDAIPDADDAVSSPSEAVSPQQPISDEEEPWV
ncbi:MAG: PRC-barrel domain-containing protein [Leptolyngbyaceae cyanobacterium bins.302]|nr:PRC-barrel domain-containing protein [Leptolyngbyaceae cyanobacterium bins.302]